MRPPAHPSRGFDERGCPRECGGLQGCAPPKAGIPAIGIRSADSDLRRKARGYPLVHAVAVAQLVEPRVVVPVVAGSNPVRHLFLLASTIDGIQAP